MSQLMQRIIDLERRMQRQEANRGASLRFGTVTESNITGSARVQLPDGADMVSHTVRTLHRRTLKDKDQCLPDVGEHVAVLFAGQGMEEGCVLGAVYSGKDASPAVPGEQDYMVYEDGTELWYDRKNHKLIAKVQGDIDAEIKGNLTAKVEGNAELETEGHISAKAQKEVRIESAVNITLRAPTIGLNGLLRVTDKDGNPGSGELYGSYKILRGSLAVPDDNISTGQQLIANVDAQICGIAFVPHTHEGVMPGPSVSGPPVGGGGA